MRVVFLGFLALSASAAAHAAGRVQVPVLGNCLDAGVSFRDDNGNGSINYDWGGMPSQAGSIGFATSTTANCLASLTGSTAMLASRTWDGDPGVDGSGNQCLPGTQCYVLAFQHATPNGNFINAGTVAASFTNVSYGSNLFTLSDAAQRSCAVIYGRNGDATVGFYSNSPAVRQCAAQIVGPQRQVLDDLNHQLGGMPITSLADAQARAGAYGEYVDNSGRLFSTPPPAVVAQQAVDRAQATLGSCADRFPNGYTPGGLSLMDSCISVTPAALAAEIARRASAGGAANGPSNANNGVTPAASASAVVVSAAADTVILSHQGPTTDCGAAYWLGSYCGFPE